MILLGSGVAALIIAALAAINQFLPDPKASHPEPTKNTAATTSRPTATTSHAPPSVPLSGPNASATTAAAETLVDDDGRTLWAPPTSGPPVDLAYLAPGTQIVVALRPAMLLQNAEGEKVIVALGPLGQQAIHTIEERTTLPLTEIDRLLIGCQIASDGQWLLTYVVEPTKPLSPEQLAAKLSGATAQEHNGQQYLLTNSLAYFVPNDDKLHRFVVAPEHSIAEIIDLAGQPPPLRRDIERLLTSTDADRNVTIVFAPNALFSEGQSMFTGAAAALRKPLFSFLGDELSGAALSLHWNENFFLELAATPTLETTPDKAARIFADRVHELPDQIAVHIADLRPQPYSQSLIARLPNMLRTLAAYTRTDYQRNLAILRCYLPAPAGHNLVMAAELTLAETSSYAPPTPAATPPTATTSSDSERPAAAGLAKLTSLKFARDTLESALDQLSQDIGIPITIRGPDLQADGITKNQSFAIDESNQPAADILVAILRLANPDKSASTASDPRQKLVYIVERKPDKTEQIVVTTRARAAERHDPLPAAFRQEKP